MKLLNWQKQKIKNKVKNLSKNSYSMSSTSTSSSSSSNSNMFNESNFEIKILYYKSNQKFYINFAINFIK